MIFFIFIPKSINIFEFPTFRVVIDPGHGGICLMPMSKHGDRYDSISGTFLDNFKDGAAYRGHKEHLIVYQIAKKVEQYLKLCAPGGDNKRFFKILNRYSEEKPRRINIITFMSRNESVSNSKAELLEDPNEDYRLFDFPNKNGTIQKGRISKINEFKPHLVVSLHMATRAPREYKGMNSVIVAPYRVLKSGLSYLKGTRSKNDKIDKVIIDNWFCESTRRGNFDWFLSDVSLYFTGYPLNRNLTVKNMFKGYRYNMVTWDYKDYYGWEYIARNHPVNTNYAKNYKKFISGGKFWKRESSKYEGYRRDGGPEGFGGDNAYASNEIIRYMLYTLHKNKINHPNQKVGKSYINVWIVPLHVNAISCFIELGYLSRRRDRYLLTKKQDELAQGIAVGIYSLFSGIRVNKRDFKYNPKGKRIDLEKYKVTNDKTYFDIVTD